MNLDRAIITSATPATLRTIPGPSLARYVYVLSLGRVYRWAPGSNLQDDGLTVLVPTTAGFLGAWLLVRPQPTVSGAAVALANADAPLTVGGGAWYALPVSTLTANHTATLGATNAAAGDEIEVTRYDLTGWTYALVNGGPAAGTIATMPVGVRSSVTAYFDGTNWIHRRSALLL